MNGISFSQRTVVVFSILLVAVLHSQAPGAIINTNGVSGRFIKVSNVNTIGRALAIGEIEAFNFGITPSAASGLSTNEITGITFEAEGVASGGITIDHGANTATFNNALDSGGATYNRSGVGVFHIIDLGSTQNIGAVRLFQRTDCCQDRLQDVRVEVLADNAGVPGTSLFSGDYARVPNTNAFGEISVMSTREIQPAGAGTVGSETQGSAGGRFISVKNNGGLNRSMQMGEIEAFLAGVVPGGSYDPANSVSLNTKGATWESEVGTFAHGFGGSMLDGAATGGGESWHRTGVGNELVIDLGQQRNVGTIRVWQRGDGCCQDRLQDFSVSLLDDNGSGAPGAVLYTGSFPGQPATNSFASFALPAFTNTKFSIEGFDTLVIDINPSAATSDLLRVGALGDGSLIVKTGGDLRLNFLNAPVNGQVFDILDFGSFSGSFDSVTFVGLPSFMFVDMSSLTTTGQISTMFAPEPTSLALWSMLGIAGCAAAWRGRARSTKIRR